MWVEVWLMSNFCELKKQFKLRFARFFALKLSYLASRVAPFKVRKITWKVRKKHKKRWSAIILSLNFMVAQPRVELGTQGFSVLCSTCWAIGPIFQKNWRTRRESNSRSPLWQSGMLTATPLVRFLIFARLKRAQII